MDEVSLSEESKERILQKTRKTAEKYGNDDKRASKLKARKYLAVAACFVLLLTGAIYTYRTSLLKTPMGNPGTTQNADIMEAAGEEELMEAEADQGYAGQDEAIQKAEADQGYAGQDKAIQKAEADQGYAGQDEAIQKAEAGQEDAARDEAIQKAEADQEDAAKEDSLGQTADGQEPVANKQAADGQETAAGQESADSDQPAQNQESATTAGPETPGRSPLIYLMILFVTALILSAIGYIKYVYFFSVGYGFSVAGIGAVMLLLFHDNIKPATGIMCLIFILYGLRLGLYLLYREIKSHSYQAFLKNEIRTNVSIFAYLSIWVSCALLYVCECSPVFFRMFNNTPDNITAYAGSILMAAGAITELIADMQKSKAKKVNPGRFVDTGLYRFVRCPNYFGELLLWTGVIITGIRACHGPLQWILAGLGYIGIVYVMFSGTRRLELRQDRTYGEDQEYQEYIKKTPILIPFLPLYSVKKHKWLVA